MVVAKLPVYAIEKIFKVAIRLFQHDRTGRVVVRATSDYQLPLEVAEHIDLIHGLSEFPPPRTMHSQPIVRVILQLLIRLVG